MIEHLGKYYEWADLRIIALLEKADEKLFTQKPEGTGRSIRDLVEHLIVYYEYFTLGKTGDSFRQIQGKLKALAKQELLDHWKAVMKSFSAAVDGFPEGTVDLPLSDGSKKKVSREAYVFCYSDHATYHRGQLITTYKTVTGQKAPATDYYDFLMDYLKEYPS